MNSVLLFRTDRVGDFLLSLSLIKIIKINYPNSKITIVASEKNVLKGGLNTIKKNKPILLIEIEEKHSKQPVEDTINFMKTYNYDAYVYINKKLVDFNLLDKKQKEINYIFIHR